MKFNGLLRFDYPLRICQLLFGFSIHLFPAKFKSAHFVCFINFYSFVPYLREFLRPHCVSNQTKTCSLSLCPVVAYNQHKALNFSDCFLLQQFRTFLE